MEQKYIFKFTTELSTMIEVIADKKKTAEDIAFKSFGYKSFEDMKVESTNCELIAVHTNKICIGDIVKVIDSGKLYSSYINFFNRYELSLKIRNRYQYNQCLGINYDDIRFTVLFFGKHESQPNNVYVIEEMNSKKIYLIGEGGIELA